MMMLKNISVFLFVIAALAACMRIDPGTGAALTVIDVYGSGFDDVPVGQTRTRSFSIKNIGGFDASTVVVPTIPTPFKLVTNNCTAELPIGDSCTLDLEFKPTTVGAVEVTVTITYQKGDGQGTLDVVLHGSGVESQGDEPPPPPEP